MLRTALLICGIVSSLLYVGADILAAMRWENYSYASQSISELMAIGAPTRPLLVALFSVYNLLVIAFGYGVWAAAGSRRALRVTGILLAVYGAAGYVGLLATPVHLGEAVGSPANTLHIALTAVIVLLLLLSFGLGALAFGQRFRLYSIATILIVLVFGALAGQQAARLAQHLPTPWMGVMERINVYGSLLWVLMLAVALLRAEKGPASKRGSAA